MTRQQPATNPDNPDNYGWGGMRKQCGYIVNWHACRLDEGHDGLHSPGRLPEAAAPQPAEAVALLIEKADILNRSVSDLRLEEHTILAAAIREEQADYVKARQAARAALANQPAAEAGEVVRRDPWAKPFDGWTVADAWEAWHDEACQRDAAGCMCPCHYPYSRLATPADPVAKQPEGLDAEHEEWLRLFLWANHGHDGRYGDDGEMQCHQCGHWDYRRDDLATLIGQARGHSQLRDLRAASVRLAATDPEAGG